MGSNKNEKTKDRRASRTITNTLNNSALGTTKNKNNTKLPFSYKIQNGVKRPMSINESKIFKNLKIEDDKSKEDNAIDQLVLNLYSQENEQKNLLSTG